MADINSKYITKPAAPQQSADADVCRPEADDCELSPSDALVKYVELLFFAYRDFTGDADELLADLGYGRAHHRVIHFVGRHPGLRVADLLDILRITKQSLARVLKQLIDEGFVTQKAGKADRRERHLLLTQKGRNFADKLTEIQCARVGKALHKVGPAARVSVETFLVSMISDQDQASVKALFEKAIKNEHSRIRATSLAQPAEIGDPADHLSVDKGANKANKAATG